MKISLVSVRSVIRRSMNLINLAFNILDLNSSNHLTFITKRTTIICIGKNNEKKSHPIASKLGYWDGRIHSELDALIKFSKTNNVLRNCKVWNIRIDNNNQVNMSKPCFRCEQILRSFGAKNIYYTICKSEFVKL